MQKKEPIRMCIICRGRFAKSKLLRYKILDKTIMQHDGVGRGLYLCKECLLKSKKVKSLSKRFKIEAESLLKLLKESMNNG